ncbi:hypothetical protein BDZ45DRAFT_738713 [Acephala macrosclerotiorum]|nr:hypothetical protein BDZ45DRAFT_738713 [Acephala macrosclerotiorum]
MSAMRIRIRDVFGVEVYDALDTQLGTGIPNISATEARANNIGANNAASMVVGKSSLPTEILLKIFDLVRSAGGDHSRVSLALAHPGLYLILKTHYEPEPIFDRCGREIEVEGVTWRWAMQYIISSFLGPDYRRRNYMPGWYRYEGSDTAFVKRIRVRSGIKTPSRVDFGDETEPGYVYHQPNRDLYSMVSYDKTMELHRTVWDSFAEWRDMDSGWETESEDTGVEREATTLEIDGSLRHDADEGSWLNGGGDHLRANTLKQINSQNCIMCFAMKIAISAARIKDTFEVAIGSQFNANTPRVSTTTYAEKTMSGNAPTVHVGANSCTDMIVFQETLQSSTLEAMPSEILTDIFERLQCRSDWHHISFGLVNKRMYNIMKGYYPEPIPDRWGEGFESWRWARQYIIGEFLGPEYRSREYHPDWRQDEGSDTPFLKRSIYGDEWGDKEKELNDRWYDYKRLWCEEPYLPKPFGMGDSWYKEAIDFVRERRVIEKDEEDFVKGTHFSVNNCLLLMKSHDKIMELHGSVWDRFAEWRDLVGFERINGHGPESGLENGEGWRIIW